MPSRASRKKRRIYLLRRALLALIVLLFLVCALLIARQLHAPRTTPERPYTDHVLGMPLYTDILPEGAPGRTGLARRIRYVVIHETGNEAAGADARAHAQFLQSGGSGSTSWHYTVDDHCAYQHLPDSEVANHAGDRREQEGGNLCGIGIEICVNSDGDFEAAFQNGARLAAFLLDSYGLTTDDLRQHADFISKNCPEHIRDAGRWDAFKAAVSDYLTQLP